MKLEDFATEAMAGNKFVKAAFAGFAGAGKSKTATAFVIGAYKALGFTKPIMIIDNENGSRFFIPAFRAAGIKAVLKDTTSVDDVLTAFGFLAAGEIEFVFADSMTKVWYRFVREYMERNRRTFMQLDDWGKVLPKWQEIFNDRFVEAQGSIVFTGRGGFSYEKEEDTRDDTGRVKKGSYVKSGVKMKMAGETPFEPDLNVWMERQEEFDNEGKIKVWREAVIMKDRSGLIDGKTFINPTYDDFAPFVNYLADAQVGPVAGQTSTRSLAPAESFEGYDTRRRAEVALEEIAEEMNKMHPGSTEAAKVARKDLLEKIFGTRSWKAVELKALSALQDGRNRIWQESRGHAYGEAPPAPSAPIQGDEAIPHEPKQDAA
jgi:hypothetical protein